MTHDYFQGRKKKAQRANVNLGSIDWEAERIRGLRVLLHLLQLHIHNLWDPPVLEEEFVKYDSFLFEYNVVYFEDYIYESCTLIKFFYQKWKQTIKFYKKKKKEI